MMAAGELLILVVLFGLPLVALLAWLVLRPGGHGVDAARDDDERDG